MQQNTQPTSTAIVLRSLRAQTLARVPAPLTKMYSIPNFVHFCAKLFQGAFAQNEKEPMKYFELTFRTIFVKFFDFCRKQAAPYRWAGHIASAYCYQNGIR